MGIFLLPNHLQVSTSSIIKKKEKKNQSSSLASKYGICLISLQKLCFHMTMLGMEGGGHVQKVLAVQQVNFQKKGRQKGGTLEQGNGHKGIRGPTVLDKFVWLETL